MFRTNKTVRPDNIGDAIFAMIAEYPTIRLISKDIESGNLNLRNTAANDINLEETTLLEGVSNRRVQIQQIRKYIDLLDEGYQKLDAIINHQFAEGLLDDELF